MTRKAREERSLCVELRATDCWGSRRGYRCFRRHIVRRVLHSRHRHRTCSPTGWPKTIKPLPNDQKIVL